MQTIRILGLYAFSSSVIISTTNCMKMIYTSPAVLNVADMDLSMRRDARLFIRAELRMHDEPVTVRIQ